MARRAVYTTIHFLCNLQMSPTRQCFFPVGRIQYLQPYSQYFIFFVTYRCPQQARGTVFTTYQFLCNLQMSPTSQSFIPSRPFQPSVIKHLIFLGPFISYKENEVLLIRYLQSYSQHFIFFVTYECPQQARVFSQQAFLSQCYIRLQLIGPFVSYK